jgi:hypothetical protein
MELSLSPHSAHPGALVSYASLLNANLTVATLDLNRSDSDAAHAGSSSGHVSARAVYQRAMPDAARVIVFRTSLACTIKGGNAVVFDLFDGPHPKRAASHGETTSWTCRRVGGRRPASGYPVVGIPARASAVRSPSENNVSTPGGLGHSTDLSQWNQQEHGHPDGNPGASWHSYHINACNTSSRRNSQSVITVGPLIADETGRSDRGGNELISEYSGTPIAFDAEYRVHT